MAHRVSFRCCHVPQSVWAPNRVERTGVLGTDAKPFPLHEKRRTPGRLPRPDTTSRWSASESGFANHKINKHGRRPRVHDLRHTFAVKRWSRTSLDVLAVLVAIGTTRLAFDARCELGSCLRDARSQSRSFATSSAQEPEGCLARSLPTSPWRSGSSWPRRRVAIFDYHRRLPTERCRLIRRRADYCRLALARSDDRSGHHCGSCCAGAACGGVVGVLPCLLVQVVCPHCLVEIR